MNAPRTFKPTSSMANEEAMRDLLAPKGKSISIGDERGRLEPDGISVFTSPFGSIRFLYSESGVALAALQVMSRDGEHGMAANVFTDPSARRRGLASKLFEQARKTFKQFEYGSDLSENGAALLNSIEARIFADRTPMPWLNDALAANGRRIQDNFKEWFGNSRMRDDSGQPQVFYHGSANQFDAFDLNRVGSVQYSDWGPGIYLTPSRLNADGYRIDAIKKCDVEYNAAFERYESLTRHVKTVNGVPQYSDESHEALKEFQRIGKALNHTEKGYIHELCVRMENPLIEAYRSMPDPYMARQAQERGHDGIIMLDGTGGINEILVFSPLQVKSIHGSGLFLRESPSLTDQAACDAILAARKAMDCVPSERRSLQP